MKILFLCTYYHRAMIFRDSMDMLEQYGHKVEAFNAVVKGAKIDPKYSDIMDELVVHRECFNKFDRFFYHHKQTKFYKKLIEEIDVTKYDIIHSHTLFNGGYVAYNINKKFGIPYIVSIRNTDMNIFLKIPLFKRIANKIIKEASGIQFLSVPYKDKFINKYLEDEYREDFIKKSVVIGNGLEKFWLDNKFNKNRTIDKSNIRVICVGKIDKNKNIVTTIKALESLILLGVNVSFTIVGQVIDKDVLNYLKQFNFIRIVEYLSKEKLIEEYRKSDIYIMPSIHETFGRVYAEAMTQGLPIIYSKGQGFDGIFEDGCVGYSVPSKDAEYIKSCIIKIIDDYSNISLRCLQYCNIFDWEKVSYKLEEFYKDSLKRGKGDN